MNLADDGRARRIVSGMMAEMDGHRAAYSVAISFKHILDPTCVSAKTAPYIQAMKNKNKALSDLMAKLKSVTRRIEESTNRTNEELQKILLVARDMVLALESLRKLSILLSRPDPVAADVNECISSIPVAVAFEPNIFIVELLWKADLYMLLARGNYRGASELLLPKARYATQFRTALAGVTFECEQPTISSLANFVVEDILLGFLEKVKAADFLKKDTLDGAASLLFDFGNTLVESRTECSSCLLCEQLLPDIKALTSVLSRVVALIPQMTETIKAIEDLAAAEDSEEEEMSPLMMRLVRHDAGKLMVAAANAFVEAHGPAIRRAALIEAVKQRMTNIEELVLAWDVDAPDALEEERVGLAQAWGELSQGSNKSKTQITLHELKTEFDASITASLVGDAREEFLSIESDAILWVRQAGGSGDGSETREALSERVKPLADWVDVAQIAREEDAFRHAAQLCKFVATVLRPLESSPVPLLSSSDDTLAVAWRDAGKALTNYPFRSFETAALLLKNRQQTPVWAETLRVGSGKGVYSLLEQEVAERGRKCVDTVTKLFNQMAEETKKSTGYSSTLPLTTQAAIAQLDQSPQLLYDVVQLYEETVRMKAAQSAASPGAAFSQTASARSTLATCTIAVNKMIKRLRDTTEDSEGIGSGLQPDTVRCLLTWAHDSLADSNTAVEQNALSPLRTSMDKIKVILFLLASAASPHLCVPVGIALKRLPGDVWKDCRPRRERTAVYGRYEKTWCAVECVDEGDPVAGGTGGGFAAERRKR